MTTDSANTASEFPDSTLFRVLIKCDNAAFDDVRDVEVARILRDVADRLEAGTENGGNVRDSNGNQVGDFGYRLPSGHTLP